MTVFGLAIAGALGAVLRYLADHLVQRRVGSDFPLGIMVVNVSGSFALGLVVGIGLHHGISAAWLTVVGTGLLGSYTTFSTFTFDAVRLAGDGQWSSSVLNVALGLAAGLAAAAGGLALGAVI
jgi:CrcB protein